MQSIAQVEVCLLKKPPPPHLFAEYASPIYLHHENIILELLLRQASFVSLSFGVQQILCCYSIFTL